MNNKVISNLFNRHEIEMLKDSISKYTHVLKLDEPQLGRTRYDIHALPKEIIQKVQGIANEINSNLEFDFAYYVEYSSEYGQPSLPVHTDSVHSKLVIDYQLDSNIDWSIYVDGHRFKLKDNDCLTINVNSQAHWRPQRNFNNGEYLKMVFFHFLDKEDPKAKILNKEERDLLAIKWKHLWDIWEN
jgi:hypothetical protein